LPRDLSSRGTLLDYQPALKLCTFGKARGHEAANMV